MTDFKCVVAGLIRLLNVPLFVLLWHKKTRSRIFPALVAFPVSMTVLYIGGIIRSGLDSSSFILYAIERGLLYGVLEEGSKFLVFRFFLSEYATGKNAVVYGIGHGAFEELGAGLSCFGLIGTGNAASRIVEFNLWAAVEGTLFFAALTVIIVYGMRMEKSKVTLPAAVLLHAVSNASATVFIDPVAIAVRSLLTAGACLWAYRCYKGISETQEGT